MLATNTFSKCTSKKRAHQTGFSVEGGNRWISPAVKTKVATLSGLKYKTLFTPVVHHVVASYIFSSLFKKTTENLASKLIQGSNPEFNNRMFDFVFRLIMFR